MQKLKTLANKIRLLSKCSICDTPLTSSMPVKMIFEDNLRSLLYLQCPACRSHLLAFLEGDEFLGTRADLYITDLEAREICDFLRQKQQLSIDYLIDFYQILEEDISEKVIDDF